MARTNVCDTKVQARWRTNSRFGRHITVRLPSSTGHASAPKTGTSRTGCPDAIPDPAGNIPSVAGRGSAARLGGSVRRDPPSAAAAGGSEVLLAVAAFQVGERTVHQQDVAVNDGLAPGTDLRLDDLPDAPVLLAVGVMHSHRPAGYPEAQDRLSLIHQSIIERPFGWATAWPPGGEGKPNGQIRAKPWIGSRWRG
jgi:hypothetical protein